jgi:hypothetical protein
MNFPRRCCHFHLFFNWLLPSKIFLWESILTFEKWTKLKCPFLKSGVQPLTKKILNNKILYKIMKIRAFSSKITFLRND